MKSRQDERHRFRELHGGLLRRIDRRISQDICPHAWVCQRAGLRFRIRGKHPQHSRAHQEGDGVADQLHTDGFGRRRSARHAGVHPICLPHVLAHRN